MANLTAYSKAETSLCLQRSKAMVFPIVMYGFESWTIKKVEHWRTDAFELWCWRRLLGVPWTVRRFNQSVLKKSTLNVHWKDWCWSWSSYTLATWCEELTHWKRSWCWERLMAGRERGGRGWGGWMASPTQWTWVWANSGDDEGQGSLTCCSPWGSQRIGSGLATEQQREHSHSVPYWTGILYKPWLSAGHRPVTCFL